MNKKYIIRIRIYALLFEIFGIIVSLALMSLKLMKINEMGREKVQGKMHRVDFPFFPSAGNFSL